MKKKDRKYLALFSVVTLKHRGELFRQCSKCQDLLTVDFNIVRETCF